MIDKRTINQKAEALVEMGLVRILHLDVSYRPKTVEVAARNLDVATVEYHRGRGTLYIVKCDHVTREGKTHVCEGHSHGHVCYHSRAGLMMAAKIAGRTLTFHDCDQGGSVKVMVAGHENKAVYGKIN